MNIKTVLCMIICLSVVEPLKLNRQRPSTAWGVQKKLFRKKTESEYFRSDYGTYQYEFDTGNTGHQIFRREKRFADGTVFGFYGYIDPEGILRITEYMAGHHGYKQRRKMESEIFKKLKTLIEVLTHSGSSTLHEDVFKDVKRICKSSQDNIPLAYNLVFAQLKKNNSQVRLSAFQICKELFKRSSLFREYVVRDLNKIFELTSEINTSKKLPLPKSSAEKLRTLSISTLKEWVEEFGETYKMLKVAYNYLEKCKQVNFMTLRVQNSAESVAEIEQQRHLRMVNEEKIRKVLGEFNSNESEIEMTLTSLSNCLLLLLPPADEFFIPEYDSQDPKVLDGDTVTNNMVTNSNKECNSITKETESSEDDEPYTLNNRNILREFGIPLDYNLTIHLNVAEKFKVRKTEENSSVIENAKDCVRLINNRFLPMLKKFIKIFCKCSNGADNELKKIIDLKERLENTLKKYNSVVIEQVDEITISENSSDDEFEEVKKEGYEDSVNFLEPMPDCLKENSDGVSSKCSPQPSSNNLNTETLPCVSTSTAEFSKASTSDSQQISRKRKLLSIAPKLPYDIDLYHWEDEQLTTPTLISTRIDVDKFWGCAGSDDIHEIPNPDGVAALRTRVIEYSGTFEPVKWACRYPLPNGKLCPRKDRFKCPFHGKIVARDEMGHIQNKDETDSGHTAELHMNLPDFQDHEFFKDLQAATGLDLKMPQREGKNRKAEQKNLTHKKMKTSAAALKIVEAKKLPGLEDVVKKQNNAYTRLSKKVFNRSSLRRVSSVLNKLESNKFRDKYGDQFNYI